MHIFCIQQYKRRDHFPLIHTSQFSIICFTLIFSNSQRVVNTCNIPLWNPKLKHLLLTIFLALSLHCLPTKTWFSGTSLIISPLTASSFSSTASTMASSSSNYWKKIIFSLTVWHKRTIWRTSYSHLRLYPDVGLWYRLQQLVGVVSWTTNLPIIHNLLHISLDLRYQGIKLTPQSIHLSHQLHMWWNPSDHWNEVCCITWLCYHLKFEESIRNTLKKTNYHPEWCNHHVFLLTFWKWKNCLP